MGRSVKAEEFGNSGAPVRAPRGPALNCQGWSQEAALRMLMNSLDEDVAECACDLTVRGSAGKPVRNWDCFHAVIRSLKQLKQAETLLVRPGEPAGIIQTHGAAPRVLIVNSLPASQASALDKFGKLNRGGLTGFGQRTAESWMYVGAQGALEGTFETFAAVARKHFGGNLGGKLVLSGGMGGTGGAQPLAAAMNGAAFLGIDVDAGKIKRRIRAGYCDYCVNSLDEALRILKNAVRQKQPVSVGLVGNCAEIIPELASRGVVPDILTDQTGAHDLLNGYIPAGLTLDEAEALRRQNPEDYLRRARNSIARHVSGMLELKKLGAITFEFGNNLRAAVYEHGGVKDAYDFPDYFSQYLRPRFSEGRAPLLCVALSGEPQDIYRLDNLLLELFPSDAELNRWIHLARKHGKFQGLPARTCTLGLKERTLFSERLNNLVAAGELRAPVVIARDHLDCGAAASALIEMERTKSKSDAGGDSPALNALLSAATNASWTCFHSSEAMETGSPCHMSQAIVADGAPSTAERLKQVLSHESAVITDTRPQEPNR